jgi:hypothetical protein
MAKINSKTSLRETPGWILSVRVLVGGAALAASAFHLLATKDAVEYQRQQKTAARVAGKQS